MKIPYCAVQTYSDKITISYLTEAVYIVTNQAFVDRKNSLLAAHQSQAFSVQN